MLINKPLDPSHFWTISAQLFNYYIERTTGQSIQNYMRDVFEQKTGVRNFRIQSTTTTFDVYVIEPIYKH